MAAACDGTVGGAGQALIVSADIAGRAVTLGQPRLTVGPVRRAVSVRLLTPLTTRHGRNLRVTGKYGREHETFQIIGTVTADKEES